MKFYCCTELCYKATLQLVLYVCSPIAYRLVPTWLPNEKYHLILTQGSGDKKIGLLELLCIYHDSCSWEIVVIFWSSCWYVAVMKLCLDQQLNNYCTLLSGDWVTCPNIFIFNVFYIYWPKVMYCKLYCRFIISVLTCPWCKHLT